MVQFLIHSKDDTVGVAVVNIKAGDVIKGLYMATQEPLEIKALEDIPSCHKISLKDMRVDDTVIKYGHDIGKVVSEIRAGEHVHIHNLKSKRW